MVKKKRDEEIEELGGEDLEFLEDDKEIEQGELIEDKEVEEDRLIKEVEDKEDNELKEKLDTLESKKAELEDELSKVSKNKDFIIRQFQSKVDKIFAFIRDDILSELIAHFDTAKDVLNMDSLRIKHLSSDEELDITDCEELIEKFIDNKQFKQAFNQQKLLVEELKGKLEDGIEVVTEIVLRTNEIANICRIPPPKEEKKAN